MSTIGSRLKSLIEAKGITPYKLSSRISVSQATLSRIINQNSIPNENNLNSIVKYFEINETWFLTGVKSTKESVSAPVLRVEGVNVELDKIFQFIIDNEEYIFNINNSFKLWISEKVYKGMARLSEDLKSGKVKI